MIEGTDVDGTDDAAIYIGNSHDVIVEHNHATDSTVGIEIENSTGIVVRGNTAIGNTSGIVTFVLPGLAVPVTEDVLIERGHHNNRPNSVLPSEDVVGLIPTGTGILSVGADRVTVRHNQVVGNDSGGIAVIALPFPTPDPRVDPFPDGNRVTGSTVIVSPSCLWTQRPWNAWAGVEEINIPTTKALMSSASFCESHPPT